MKTIFRTAPLALSLFLGLLQSASAGAMFQEVTLSAKLGSSPMPGFSARTPPAVMPALVSPAVVTPSAVTPAVVMPAAVPPVQATPTVVTQAPARFFPSESALTPVPMPAEVPTALDDPATVPEPGTVATLAAGLALMGAVVRRRRAAR